MSLGQADLDFWVWWPDKIPSILSPPPNEERIIMCPWIVCLGHVSCTIITVRGFSWRELALKVYWDCPLAIRNSPSQFKGLSGGTLSFGLSPKRLPFISVPMKLPLISTSR